MASLEKPAKEHRDSDSSVQRDIEDVLAHEFSVRHGVSLERNMSASLGDVSVELDGISRERHMIVEFYAHQGKLKSAQKNKVLADILKMVLFERRSGAQWEKYFVFACEDARKSFIGTNAWRNAAAREFSVSLETIVLSEEQRRRIADAQRKQDLLNRGAAGNE